MKVLENGLMTTDIVCCSNCNSKLEINKYDLFEQPIGLFNIAYAVRCPICNKTMIYNGRKLTL